MINFQTTIQLNAFLEVDLDLMHYGSIMISFDKKNSEMAPKNGVLENIHKGIIICMKYKTNMIIGVSANWSTLGNLFHFGWCTNVCTRRLKSH